jgi:hypothetical protein
MSVDIQKQVPPDFPRGPNLGSVSGVQPKLLVRHIDGKFVSGWTEEEVYARFDSCLDLVEQLTVYSRRKLAERPELTPVLLLPQVRTSLHSKGWDFTEEELNWVMMRLYDKFAESAN